MNDFNSMDEEYQFSLLDPVPPVSDLPFRAIDTYRHSVYLEPICSSFDERRECLRIFDNTFRSRRDD